MSDARTRAKFGVPMTRRKTVTAGLTLAAGGALAARPGPPAARAAWQATPVASRDEQTEIVVALARDRNLVGALPAIRSGSGRTRS